MLDTESNVQFGEGGAGTFSDGKLTTMINDKRCRSIIEQFIKAGAPPDILYKSKPHIGTDILKSTVINIRKEIIANGGEVRFKAKVVHSQRPPAVGSRKAGFGLQFVSFEKGSSEDLV